MFWFWVEKLFGQFPFGQHTLLTGSSLMLLSLDYLIWLNAYSKLLDVVSVADIDAEEGVDDRLVGILKLNFGQGMNNGGWNLAEILRWIFGEDFKTGIWSRFWSWSLVQTLRLIFGRVFKAAVWFFCILNTWNMFNSNIKMWVWDIFVGSGKWIFNWQVSHCWFGYLFVCFFYLWEYQ